MKTKVQVVRGEEKITIGIKALCDSTSKMVVKTRKVKKKGVRFPDELVFLDNIKENDIRALDHMLRRASLQVDISGINDIGLTPLHQAVLDGNESAVRLLVAHDANINKQDDDSWTPLHAACAEGYADIVAFLLDNGADKNILTDDGERPLDLVEQSDFETIRVMLGHAQSCNNDKSDDNTLEQDDGTTVSG